MKTKASSPKQRTGKTILSDFTRRLIKTALAEDVGRGDRTSELVVPKDVRGEALIYAREDGIFCGAPVVREVLVNADPWLRVEFFAAEGQRIRKNTKTVRITGPARGILKAERTALNFLGHLSGIATLTHTYAEAVKKYHVLILDTRKTTPLWRELEKYAVKTGGGRNHRMGLYDAVFIKENHRVYGDLEKLRDYDGHVEIEVRNQTELREALKLNPRVILFDNFTPARLGEAVRLARRLRPETILEASGGINLENVTHYAAMGVDWISIGSLTHSVRSLDFSLLMQRA